MGSTDLNAFFGAAGALSRVLEGYSPRPGQLLLARAVEETLENGGVLLAEAGTGTGKTLAYLIPAALIGKKVIVTTATKTLQAQILQKDVPLASRALGRPVSAALLKGRQNYLCLRRFESFRTRPLFRFVSDSSHYEKLERWAGSTTTGDRSDLVDVPEDYGPWREVCSTTDTCWGGKCPHEADCHFQQHRRGAQKAQVLVVNHHLFFADLALRTTSSAEVLPRYGAVVFDEAHHLEAVATQYFGVQVSSFRVAEAVRDLVQFFGGGKRMPETVGGVVASASEASTALWEALTRTGAQNRLRKRLQGSASAALDALAQALARAGDILAPRQAESQEAENLHSRLGQIRADLLRFSLDPGGGEVRWVEIRGRGTFLHAAPVEVAPHLKASLFDTGIPLVLTSATLRAGASFDYLTARLGVEANCRQVVVDSPFEFDRQGLLYVPQEISEPNGQSFPQEAAREIRRLLEASRGRAFCLFTSHRVLQLVADDLRKNLPYRLLVQGDAPRESLLRAFRDDVHSVLLGAQAFWEGVDVPGEALSAVIIDRIPFASPSDPLVEARIETVRKRGGAPFWEYQLPAAAMALRQGIGRLIRRTEDRGVVAILDRRLLESAYSRFLTQSLPPLPFTRNLESVKQFLQLPSEAGQDQARGRRPPPAEVPLLAKMVTDRESSAAPGRPPR